MSAGVFYLEPPAVLRVMHFDSLSFIVASFDILLGHDCGLVCEPLFVQSQGNKEEGQ
jgi:hypothetical protein